MTELPSFDLTGQVALVTGASSGIGRHLAELLAAAGAKVALAARRVDRLGEAAREIAAAGGQGLAIACDVTRPDSVATSISRTLCPSASSRTDVQFAPSSTLMSAATRRRLA